MVLNAKVWTGEAKQPEAEAVAVLHGRIVKVGTTEEVKALVGTKAKVIDAGGRRVVPGFNDSHLHFLGGGQQLARVELKDCKDEAEFAKRIQEFDANTPRDRWMLGGNWDHDRAFKGKLPTAAFFDHYVKDRPVYLKRYDGHMGVVNSVVCVVVQLMFPWQMENLGGAHTFLIYGIFAVLGVALIWRLVPETRGRSLEQLEDDLVRHENVGAVR